MKSLEGPGKKAIGTNYLNEHVRKQFLVPSLRYCHVRFDFCSSGSQSLRQHMNSSFQCLKSSNVV